jgi:outer membrane immunogenic protein
MLKSALVTLAVSAGVFLTATTVQAADPFVDPAYDWSGGYLGLQAGYGWGDSIQIDANNVSTGGYDIEGFVGGVTAGWNHQVDNFVVGVETDLSMSSIDGASGAPFAGLYTTDINWFGTGRLRAGFAVDEVLLYATGGLAFGEIEADAPFANVKRDKVNLGWTVGAGAEWAATQNLSLKLEYLFVDLGDITIPSPVPLTADADENHIVRMGLNWHF